MHASTREEALKILETRLRSAQIAGPVINTAFLANLCAHSGFVAGRFDTSLIDQNIDDLISKEPVSDGAVARGVAKLIEQQISRIQSENVTFSASPWQINDGFQQVGSREIDFAFVQDGEDQTVRLLFEPPLISVKGEDDRWVAPNAQSSSFGDASKVFVLENGKQAIFEPRLFESTEGGSGSAQDGVIVVPMHGKIIAVTVQDGDTVEEGDFLFSVEAMKMEHAVIAPYDGTVSQLAIEVGGQMENGFAAMRLEPLDETA